MSMPTPTGDAMTVLPGWMPDEATLTRMANDLFGALAIATPAAAVPIQENAELPGPPAIDLPVGHGAALPSSQPGPAFELPVPGHAGPPSFYFVSERPSAVEPQHPAAAYGMPFFDVEAVRQDFPILRERVHGRQLVWLDNAATTQKPQAVIDRLADFYARENSNIHRAAHTLAARATDAYEGARTKVADFLGASSSDDIVFTRGTTEAINLVAQAWGRKYVGPGDEIMISYLEHHANIVPWQQLVQHTGATLKVIPVDDDGQLLMDAYADLLSRRTRLVSVAQVSNVLGTIVPVREIIGSAPGSSSTGRSPSRKYPSMFRRWTLTSSCSPGTRYSRQPGSECSTASRKPSPRRRHGRAAET